MKITGKNKKDDLLLGTMQKDVMKGLGGNDALLGLGGNDRLVGGGGLDALRGGDGDDSAYGGAGIDALFGEAGDDFLFGGAGNDVLWGMEGKDVLVGGPGVDSFFFRERDGFDVIRDFGKGRDLIVIDAVGPQSDFRGTSKKDVDIKHGAKWDKVYVDGDLVAKVKGDVTMNLIAFADDPLDLL